MHILASRAKGTVDKYMSYLKPFYRFCARMNFKVKPANSIHVAMFLSELVYAGKSDKVVSATFYAIKWFHNIHYVPDPTQSKVVKKRLECAKRHVSKKDS